MTYRSYSQISSYLNCPKAYQLGRVVRATEKPAWFLVAGTAIHSCLEVIAREPEEDFDLEKVWDGAFAVAIHEAVEKSGVPEEAWRTGGRTSKDKPNGEDKSFWVTDGLRQVELFNTWFKDRLAEGWSVAQYGTTPAVELALNFSLGEVPVKGYADLMMNTPSGETIIIDHKTGSRLPDSSRQLALYALALRKMGNNIDGVLGAYFMTRKGELSAPYQFLEEDFLSLQDTFEMVDLGIKAEIFPAKPSSMCKACGLAEYCAAVNGSLAKDFDPIYTNGGK